MQKELKINLTLMFITIFVFFLLVEIIVRYKLNSEDTRFGASKDLFIIDETRGYKFKPSYEGNFLGRLYKNITIKINSKGLRDYEHEYTKPNNTIRILGLGDSITAGAGVNFEDTYLSLLEKKLKDNGYDVEIINGGVGGYEFDQEYSFFTEELYKYDPDILILQISLNDIGQVNIDKVKDLTGFGTSITSRAKSFIASVCNSCLYFSNTIRYKGRDYNKLYFNNIRKKWDEENDWRYTSRKMQQLVNYSKKGNIKLIVIIFPYTQQFRGNLAQDWRVPQDYVKNFADSNGVLFIDFYHYLNTPDYQKLYMIGDNQHLNIQGNKLISNLLYEKLINNSYILSKNDSKKNFFPKKVLSAS